MAAKAKNKQVTKISLVNKELKTIQETEILDKALEARKNIQCAIGA